MAKGTPAARASQKTSSTRVQAHEMREREPLWTRSYRETSCAGCGERILAGAAVLYVPDEDRTTRHYSGPCADERWNRHMSPAGDGAVREG
ncbi:MAG TPA: hypothetical protein VGS01_09685 [Candidatus Limnocylindria bacterium]|jgi:hypothetical protein|nr:hypothetical protein [Candidatus Limnocylindria bacterium]